jgi:hypothetical protein
LTGEQQAITTANINNAMPLSIRLDTSVPTTDKTRLQDNVVVGRPTNG